MDCVHTAARSFRIGYNCIGRNHSGTDNLRNRQTCLPRPPKRTRVPSGNDRTESRSMAEGEEEEEWRSRGASRRNSTLPQHDASSARPSVRPTDSLDTMLEVAPGNANERRGSSFAVERRGSSFARRSSDISRRESILERRDSSFGIGRPRSSTLGATDDDVTAIRLAESRAEAAPDEAFASSLAESTAALEELITSASKRVHEVQEGAAEQLTPDARAEFEKAMADVFDGMMRNANRARPGASGTA